MTSKEVKSDMLFHCLYRLHYIGAVTEYGGTGVGGIADIFCLLESGFTHEFEVKVNKSDLDSELRSIKYHLEKQANLLEKMEAPPKALNKSYKHSIYLRGEEKTWFSQNSIPNKFSFAVSPELVDHARQALEGTPYGLYKVHEPQTGVEPECLIKAKYLHKTKADESLKLKILRKACMEVQSLRQKLL